MSRPQSMSSAAEYACEYLPIMVKAAQNNGDYSNFTPEQQGVVLTALAELSYAIPSQDRQFGRHTGQTEDTANGFISDYKAVLEAVDSSGLDDAMKERMEAAGVRAAIDRQKATLSKGHGR